MLGLARVPGVFHLFPLDLPLPTWNLHGLGELREGVGNTPGVTLAMERSPDDKFG